MRLVSLMSSSRHAFQLPSESHRVLPSESCHSISGTKKTRHRRVVHAPARGRGFLCLTPSRSHQPNTNDRPGGCRGTPSPSVGPNLAWKSRRTIGGAAPLVMRGLAVFAEASPAQEREPGEALAEPGPAHPSGRATCSLGWIAGSSPAMTRSACSKSHEHGDGTAALRKACAL